MKKSNGPKRLPVRAKPAPSAASTGRNVPQKIGSPTPANGPIKPTFTPLIAESSMSLPFARSCSIAAVTPMIDEATQGWVLKNSKWRFNAAA